jgi:hypothetical protein
MLKVKKLVTKDKIYGYSELCGFGDIWAMTNYLLRVSQELGKPARFFSRAKHIGDTIKEIVPLLKSKGSVNIVGPHEKILSYCEPFSIKFLPTIKEWSPTSNIIAYQFDGRHLQRQKNLPCIRLAYLINSLMDMGYDPVDVGGYKPLEYIVDILSKCQFFVGCPSGLSVVSLSVGNPVFLITRQMDPLFLLFMHQCQYRDKDVRMYTTVDEFLIQVKRMRGMGRLL